MAPAVKPEGVPAPAPTRIPPHIDNERSEGRFFFLLIGFVAPLGDGQAKGGGAKPSEETEHAEESQMARVNRARARR